MELSLPLRGLTMLPPWPQAVIYSDKRLENRGYGVAARVGSWRGMIALSQSKHFNADDALDDAVATEIGHSLPAGKLGRKPQWALTAGKLLAVAELLDVLPPERCAGADWHVDRQHGLILGRVWEVEPVEYSGCVGFAYVGQCVQCMRYIGREGLDTQCRFCARDTQGVGPIEHRWHSPALAVKRECVP